MPARLYFSGGLNEVNTHKPPSCGGLCVKGLNHTLLSFLYNYVYFFMTDAISQPRTGRVIRSPRVAEKRSRLYAALLEVGTGLFVERGVAKVSVEDIIAAAGTSRATFYGFFANKAELIAAALGPVFETAAARMRELQSVSAEAVIPGIIDLYLELWAHNANAMLLIGVLDESVFPYIADAHNDYVQNLASLFDQPAACGLLRSGSADYAFRVLGRTAVPLLRAYHGHPEMEQLYRESMLALLTSHKGENHG